MWIFKKKTDEDLLAAHQTYFHFGIFYYFWLACFWKGKKKKNARVLFIFLGWALWAVIIWLAP